MKPIPALIAGVGVASVVGLVASVSGARLAGGPLAEKLPSNAVTFSVNPRVAFTYGGVQLRHRGPGTVVLDEVRLVGATAGLIVVAARVLPVSRTDGGLWFSYERFPPPGVAVEKLQPLGGYALSVDPDGVQVLLELIVPGEGVYEFRSVAVDYRADGRRHRATFPFAMRVCASAAAAHTCPPLEAPGSSRLSGQLKLS